MSLVDIGSDHYAVDVVVEHKGRRVVIRAANAAAVSMPKMARSIVRRALTMPGGFGLPDVVLFCEVSPVDVAVVASTHRPGMFTHQVGEIGSPDAGLAIVSTKPIRHPGTRLGSRPARGLRMRPILTGRTHGIPVAAVHAPPARNPVARAIYLARVTKRRGVVGGDFNRRVGWMRKHFWRKYRGHGVIGLLVPRHYRASRIRRK